MPIESRPGNLALLLLAAAAACSACSASGTLGDLDDDGATACPADRIDDCGVCDGEDAGKDCAGACFGTALLDDCGVCDGGNASKDCAGICNGGAQLDECGVCEGGDAGMDCAGVCFGEAEIDGCGVCAGGTTGIPPSPPESCAALPDLYVDPVYLASEVSLDTIWVEDDDCWIEEGCVGGPGLRRVVRFGTLIANIGTADLALGHPPGDGFVYNDCHGHYHYDDYANYQLFQAKTGEEVQAGHKNGWCVLDLGTWDSALAVNGCDTYSCGNMGIGVGCYDAYWADLDCQWVDVTDLSDGQYTLTVTTNPDGDMPELDYSNNAASVTIELGSDSVSVVD